MPKDPMRRNQTRDSSTSMSAILILVAAVAAGCGGLGDPDRPAKALATVQGEVTNASQVSAGGQVRMALVWSNAPTETDNTFAVSQDIPMQTQFPAAFSLKITTLPPKAMVMTKQDLPKDEQDELPDGFGFAVGALVVYADDNGNGQLDLIDVGDQPLDRILGADAELMMLYFEGTLPPPLVPPDKLEGSFKLGYNLVRWNDCVLGSEVGDRGACQGKSQATKIKVYDGINGTIDGVEIPLTKDPKLSSWMCKKGGFGDGVASAGGATQMMGPAQAPYPAADDPKLACQADGTAYVLQTCTEIDHGPCAGTEISCVGEHYTMPDPSKPPVGWPCPLAAASGGGQSTPGL